MPVIPVLQAAGSLLSPKMATFLVLKNLLFWPIWALAFFRLKRHYRIPDKWAAITVLLLLLAPYNLNIAGWVDVEEGFLFPLLALLFSLLLTLEGALSALALGLTLAAIYLTKSSMFPLCIVASIWILIRYWRNPRVAAIPILSVALTIFGWGIYIHAVSGVFAVGADASSWNGWNFYKGNNPYAYSLYPRVSLDTLDSDDRVHGLLPSVPIHSEWGLSHAQFALARTYIRDHPGATLQMDLKKLFVACCDLKESPEKTAGHSRMVIRLSNGISHLTMALRVSSGDLQFFAPSSQPSRNSGRIVYVCLPPSLFCRLPIHAAYGANLWSDEFNTRGPADTLARSRSKISGPESNHEGKGCFWASQQVSISLLIAVLQSSAAARQRIGMNAFDECQGTLLCGVMPFKRDDREL